jgi:hypothetical protein
MFPVVHLWEQQMVGILYFFKLWMYVFSWYSFTDGRSETGNKMDGKWVNLITLHFHKFKPGHTKHS